MSKKWCKNGVSHWFRKALFILKCLTLRFPAFEVACWPSNSTKLILPQWLFTQTHDQQRMVNYRCVLAVPLHCDRIFGAWTFKSGSLIKIFWKRQLCKTNKTSGSHPVFPLFRFSISSSVSYSCSSALLLSLQRGRAKVCGCWTCCTSAVHLQSLSSV